MAQRHGVLAPGQPMPTHPVVKVAAKTFRYERVEMTTVRWFILAFAVEAIIIATLCMIGSATGFFGPHKIQGGSATDFAPQGSIVWSLPMKPKVNDRVMAWVYGDQNSPDPADRQPSLVLKRYKGDAVGLDSSTASTKYSPGQYEIRSVVFAVWHTEKWFPWLNTGTQVPGTSRTPTQQRAIDDHKAATLSGHVSAEVAKGLIREQPFVLGPTNTHPATTRIPIPHGAARVRWEMSAPSLRSGGKVRVGDTGEQVVPPDNCPVKGQMTLSSKTGTGELRLALVEDKGAVMGTVRFYSH